jgi:hypothetical protein
MAYSPDEYKRNGPEPARRVRSSEYRTKRQCRRSTRPRKLVGNEQLARAPAQEVLRIHSLEHIGVNYGDESPV